MRESLLRWLYNRFPFELQGDCSVPSASGNIQISCIINFYGRLDLLEGILFSLADQDYDRSIFEVVLIEDRGGTIAGRQLAESFQSLLQIVYMPLDKNYGNMGYSRNFGLSGSRGKVVLFLDDDTILMQKNFLGLLDLKFRDNPAADAIIPQGHASFAIVDGRYDHHDRFFMTSRCMAYRREALIELGGFISDFIGQEDVEFIARFFMAGKCSVKAAELNYYHPPLLVSNLGKPKAVGNSFFHLKGRYPLLLWLLILLNCSRHAPLYLLPIRRYREMGRFGIGFVLGVLASLFKNKGFEYK